MCSAFGANVRRGIYSTRAAWSSEERIVDKGHDKLSTIRLAQGSAQEANPRLARANGGAGASAQGRRIRCVEDHAQRTQNPPRRTNTQAAQGDQAAQSIRRRRGILDGVDRGLFEELRQWRKGVADEKMLPPFVIFSDATLRDLARYRPVKMEHLAQISGIGEKKLIEYGAALKKLIRRYCEDNRLDTDVQPGEVVLESAAPPPAPTGGSMASSKPGRSLSKTSPTRKSPALSTARLRRRSRTTGRIYSRSRDHRTGGVDRSGSIRANP